MKALFNERKGISLTEAAVGLIILSLVGTTVGLMINENVQSSNARQAGQQLAKISQAAKSYVDDNRTALKTQGQNDPDKIFAIPQSAF